MPNEDAAAARAYRRHAREIRAIAAAAHDPGVRNGLLWIARDYENMALVRLRIGKLTRSMRGYRSPGPQRVNCAA
jgi:hypothetical protein